jgi:hypothetical protein
MEFMDSETSALLLLSMQHVSIQIHSLRGRDAFSVDRKTSLSLQTNEQNPLTFLWPLLSGLRFFAKSFYEISSSVHL